METKKKMLEGVRVVDLSRNLAAPFCTMLLADLGAEIIKVEAPEKGDDARSYGPIINGKSGYFISVNRGKKSVELNLKDPAQKEKLGKLIQDADVLLDNFRPGVLDRLGITKEWVYGLNPQIIFASLTGFGQTGPYRSKAAYDLVVQGYGGLMSVTGNPGDGPTRIGISIGDLAAGLFMTIGILADLFAREKNGVGDRLDVAMLDCQVALLENSLIRYFATGNIPKPIGNRHASITPFEMFPTADSYMIICAGNTKNWVDLCHALEREDWLENSLFATNDSRTAAHDELYAEISGELRKRTTEEWLAVLEKAGVPCGPVNNIADICRNEQVLARDMIVSIDYPEIGEVRSPGCPIKSDHYDTLPQMPAPELGQHNEEILSAL